MSNFNKKYQKIISDIEENIKDKEQLNFVNKKIDEVSNAFAELILDLTKTIEEKIDEIDYRVALVAKRVQAIENDIYEDEDGEFGILCPYCNNEFSVNLDENENGEIKCPECNNTIELNWDYDDCEDECGCGCGCNSDCDCGCQDGEECTCDDLDCGCGCNHEHDCGCEDDED